MGDETFENRLIYELGFSMDTQDAQTNGQHKDWIGKAITLINYGIGNLLSELGVLQGDITRFGVAIEEALVNGSHHGNLSFDSALKEPGKEKDLEKWLKLKPSEEIMRRTLKIRIKLFEISDNSDDEHHKILAEITIQDEGDGFDVESLPDPTDPENVDRISGRGVILIIAFTDKVIFSGNSVTLIKNFNLSSQQDATVEDDNSSTLAEYPVWF